MRKRKLSILLICMLVAMLFCTACQNMPDRDKEPCNYPGTRWVSEEPNMWFEVPEDGNEDEIKGILVLPEGEMEINVGFAVWRDYMYINGQAYVIWDEYETGGFLGEIIYSNGDCEYSPDECVVTINPEEDTLFEGKYETIVFKRESLEKDSE